MNTTKYYNQLSVSGLNRLVESVLNRSRYLNSTVSKSLRISQGHAKTCSNCKESAAKAVLFPTEENTCRKGWSPSSE